MSTTEGRLADLFGGPCAKLILKSWGEQEYTLTDHDRDIVVSALRTVHTAKEELHHERDLS
jgi:hypothetical protein